MFVFSEKFNKRNTKRNLIYEIFNKIKIPLEIINLRNLIYFSYYDNPKNY
jgi:hypothetical protein